MPKARAFPFSDSQAGVFHVVSRIAGREFLLDEAGRDFLTKVVHAYAELLGVQVLTHCTMGNHFHLLLRVPRRPEMADGGASVEELLAMLQKAVGAEQMKLLRLQLENWQQAGALEHIEAWRQRQIAAMFSLSEFVKRVKQRFARWYNKRTGRVGVLWEDRYRSTIVEDEAKALRMMAAYIDLNPVRAGLVKDPKDYRWCGYAEALGGSRRAQRGLCKALSKPVDGWKSAGAAEAYRCLLHAEGREVKDAQNENVVRRGVSVESARAVLAKGGKLSPAELVHLRVRYFSDGIALGSKQFVEGLFMDQREHFGPKRKRGSRRMAESDEPFYTLRQLRTRPLS